MTSLKKLFYTLTMGIFLSQSPAWALTTCDQRQPEDIAEQIYSKKYAGVDGYQIDFVNLLDHENSYRFDVRVCRTTGTGKCSDPAHFGVTFRVVYKPTAFGDYSKNRRCLDLVTSVGD